MKFALVLVPIGLVVGCSISAAYWQAQAIATGHAEYYLDKDNVRQWHWKEIK